MSDHHIDLDGVESLALFLNARNGDGSEEMGMQMLKLAEEVGEVAAAWIGYQGQNPRKGFTHCLDDVLDELADVAITAMVAIRRLEGNPAAVIGEKVAVMRQRYEALEAQA